MSLAEIDRALTDELKALRFGPPVAHVYNPLVYAAGPRDAYLRRFGRGTKEVLLLGMNPGPWGMAQTGVPFGDVTMVRGWLGIEGPVGKPDDEHPKRAVSGFDCPRSEVSGTRLWGWARDRFGTPEVFFARFLVLNYCPLLFLEESGRNRTPDKLPKSERTPLTEACDRALADAVEILSPDRVIGVGVYARDAARRVLGDSVAIGCMLHPSPASPRANRGWAVRAEADLLAAGVVL